MDKREYLIEHGFKIGSRGRFSKEMITFLEQAESNGVEFDSPIKPAVYERVSFTFPEQPRLRDPETLYGYTKEGYRVGFITCAECKQHMIFCDCEGGIVAPAIIVKVSTPLAKVASGMIK